MTPSGAASQSNQCECRYRWLRLLDSNPSVGLRCAVDLLRLPILSRRASASAANGSCSCYSSRLDDLHQWHGAGRLGEFVWRTKLLPSGRGLSYQLRQFRPRYAHFVSPFCHGTPFRAGLEENRPVASSKAMRPRGQIFLVHRRSGDPVNQFGDLVHARSRVGNTIS